jgi:serine/threonine protein kinase
MLQPGAAIADRYEIVAMLGEGAMGAVYEATERGTMRGVAIKVLHPQFADNKKVVDRFFNEARAVNLIGHDNILKILDLNQTEDGRPYFIMELLEGQALQVLVEPGLPVPLDVSGPILLQFCEALQAAHDRKIYHRDVKPDNVYLISHKGRKNFVKVVDFGIAKLTEQAGGGSGTTQTGMVVGTPAYMSPEQAAGVHNKIDGRSDVYSTGVMMFQLATGKLPFPSANFGEVLIGHMRLDPPKPRDMNPEIPLEYEHIILTALAKDQDARQQSMRELETQIAEVMQALQISKELPKADDIAQSPDMVRLAQQDGPLGARKRAERPKFREAEVSKKASGPLKKSGQTLATRLAPAPTAIQENPQRRVAPLPPKPNPLRLVALGLGGVVLLAVVVLGSVTIFSSADPLHRKGKKKKLASVSDTAAPVDEPIGPTLLSVVSDPLGANVAASWKDGGNRSGPTPIDIRVPRDTKVTLVFSMPGFSPYRQDVIADESQVVTAVMQKDGSGHTKVTRRPKNNEDVIDVEDQMKSP